MANHWTAVQTLAKQIRVATEADRPDILQLLQSAHLQHVHLDWKLPADWLGAPGFVVLPAQAAQQRTLSDRLFSSPAALSGCLAATADPAPAAWVRLAAIRRGDAADRLLRALLQRAEQALRETAVTQLAWLATSSWPNPWLPALGFEQEATIRTYTKPDLTLPWQASNPLLHVRPAARADLPALARIEAAAFTPIWRYSQDSLQQAFEQAASFDVVTDQARILGFQFSTIAGGAAHLARMAVHPDAQGQGVGRALLTAAIHGYRTRGVTAVSLNTQEDNHASRALYEKFGFQATDQRLPVWVKAVK